MLESVADKRNQELASGAINRHSVNLRKEELRRFKRY